VSGVPSRTTAVMANRAIKKITRFIVCLLDRCKNAGICQRISACGTDGRPKPREPVRLGKSYRPARLFQARRLGKIVLLAETPSTRVPAPTRYLLIIEMNDFVLMPHPRVCGGQRDACDCICGWASWLPDEATCLSLRVHFHPCFRATLLDCVVLGDPPWPLPLSF
jgi:hypothetical protein